MLLNLHSQEDWNCYECEDARDGTEDKVEQNRRNKFESYKRKK